MTKKKIASLLALLMMLVLAGNALATVSTFTADEFMEERLESSMHETNAFLTAALAEKVDAYRDELAAKGYNAPAYLTEIDWMQDIEAIFGAIAAAASPDDVAKVLEEDYVVPAEEPTQEMSDAYAAATQAAGLPAMQNALYKKLENEEGAWRVLAYDTGMDENGFMSFQTARFNADNALTYLSTGKMVDPQPAEAIADAQAEAAIAAAEQYVEAIAKVTRGSGDAKTSQNVYKTGESEPFVWVWVPDNTSELIGDTQQLYGTTLAVGVETGTMYELAVDQAEEHIME